MGRAGTTYITQRYEPTWEHVDVSKDYERFYFCVCV